MPIKAYQLFSFFALLKLFSFILVGNVIFPREFKKLSSLHILNITFAPLECIYERIKRLFRILLLFFSFFSSMTSLLPFSSPWRYLYICACSLAYFAFLYVHSMHTSKQKERRIAGKMRQIALGFVCWIEQLNYLNFSYFSCGYRHVKWFRIQERPLWGRERKFSHFSFSMKERKRERNIFPSRLCWWWKIKVF